LKSTEEILSLSRQYQANDFPNPDGVNCPPPGSLRALVLSGKLPGDELRAHLLDCSECFREHHDALLERRASAETKPVSWWARLANFSLQPKLALAGVAFALLMGVVAAAIWYHLRSASNAEQTAQRESAVESPQQGNAVKQSGKQPSPISAPSSPPKQTVDRPPQKSEPPVLNDDASVLIAQAIDLNYYSSVRGSSSSRKSITLKAAKYRLTLSLPAGSDPGEYDIAVTNESGKALRTAKANSKDGQALIVSVDLRGLGDLGKHLVISPVAGARQEYDLAITK